MSGRYHEVYFSRDVRAAQERTYGQSHGPFEAEGPDRLGPDEVEFIAQRDSFYLATVTSSGWPYIQHRGGPRGFLRILDDQTLAFGDLRGNRQLISIGNLASNDRVALFLMDYRHRARLKIAGRARVLEGRPARELIEQIAPSGDLGSVIERAVLIDVEAFDWNCRQHITRRLSEEELREVVGPLQARIAALEAELERPR